MQEERERRGRLSGDQMRRHRGGGGAGEAGDAESSAVLRRSSGREAGVCMDGSVCVCVRTVRKHLADSDRSTINTVSFISSVTKTKILELRAVQLVLHL